MRRSVLKPCAKRNPDDLGPFHEQIAGQEIRNALRKDPFNLPQPPSNSIGYAYERIKRWINTQRKASSQLSEGRHGGFLGEFATLEDIYPLIKNKKQRALLEERLDNLRQVKADGVAAQILRENHVNMKDAEKIIRKIAKRDRVSTAEVNKRIYNLRQNTPEAIESVEAADPLMAQALAIFDKDHKYMTELILKNPDLTKAMRETITQNEARHLMRQYAIHKQNKLILQELETKNDAYKELFAEMKTSDDYSRFREEIVDEWRPEIERLNPDLSDEAITSILDTIIDNRINGQLNALIKNTLANPDSRWLKGVIVKSKGEYLIKRLVKDSRVRALMGEETNATIAAANLAGKVAHDVKSLVLTHGIYDELKAVGLVSKDPLPGLDVMVNKRTLRQFRENIDDPSDGVFYTNASVRNVLEQMEDGLNQGILSKIVAYVKLGKILTPKLMVNNTIGAVQSAMMGGGFFRTLKHPYQTLKDINLSIQLSRELARPSTAGMSKDMSKFLRDLGFKDMDELRELADDFVKRGLDIGGEYHTEGMSVIRSAMRGDPGAGGTIVQKTKRGMAKLGAKSMDIYRIPDIAAKVYIYRRMIEEISYKEGIAIADMTEDMFNKAAKDTLRLAQDPRTTAAGIRNLSKGPVGIAVGGFQGFFYQQARNIANASKMVFEDGAAAVRAKANGDNAKAARYAIAAADRAISIGLVGYGTYAGLEEAYNKSKGNNEDKATALKTFLSPEEQNSTVWMGEMTKGKDGQMYVEVIKPSSLDVYDGTMSILRAFMKHGTENPMAAILEAKDALMAQFLAPGLVIEAIDNMRGKSLDVNPNFLETSPYPWVERSPKEVSAARTALPTLIGDVTGYFRALDEMADPENAKTYEKAKSKMFGLQAKAGIASGLIPGMEAPEGTADTLARAAMATAYRMNFSQSVRNKFSEEYRKETWLPDAKKEWQSRSTNLQKKTSILKANEDKWNSMIERLIDVSHDAQKVGLSKSEIYRIMKDKEGFLAMPKEVARAVAVGRKVSFREYMYGLNQHND